MTPALADATARAIQRLELAAGSHVAAFDRLGIGISGQDFCDLFPSDEVARTVIKAVMLCVEAGRAQRVVLARHARAYAEADRRWSKVNPGQLALDGIEPARQVPGEPITHRQKLRLALWIRSGGTCEDCGRTGENSALDIHHLTYDRYGHEEPSDVTRL